ncbi:MAG: phosphoribosylglycinamide formyltransferase [Thermoguttaceae bacterium]|nr:phosphoribosylglycinamide formyltransferase [Thermoguttaceae bacterium]MBQ1864486.1 phosphoribosylglycinamide formyltransferase [Thermoguttaceae bacterium]MBQ2038134.1 phosphoribosylglycinamide formyltransferase [Thermoguttaceae bacterium]MBQ2555481.1 phosphoribosylglycinamide formyltransferase [Thermoguttaceae bacterium]MBQ3823306.1 phosphoribosylglycinamide formyltransferase [Thermoguttaceae bacterium]
MADKMPIAVLISGRGRTLRNILDKIDANELDVKINLVIGSKNCYGLQFAEKKNIPTDVVESSQYSDIETFSEAVFAKCRRSMARYVVMAGYLSKLRIPHDFENRVLNIHPSLIPSFCGKGFYGRSVHEAALRQGVKVSGCTVHFVDNEYDHGPIILQKVVPVLEDDTTDTLSDRVLYDAEFKAYPEALQLLAEKKIQIETVEGVSGARQIVRILK